MKFHIFFPPRSKNSSNCDEIFSVNGSELHSMFIGKHFGEDCFDEFISLYLFLDFERQLLWLLSVKEFVGMSNCFVRVRWTIVGQTCNLSFFKLTSDFEGNYFGHSVKCFRKCCQNCTLRVQVIVWRKVEITYLQISTEFFGQFHKNSILGAWATFCVKRGSNNGMVITIAFYVSISTF